MVINKDDRITWGFGLLFSMVLVIGKEVYTQHGIGRFIADPGFTLRALVLVLIITAGIFILIEYVLLKLILLISDKQNGTSAKPMSEKRLFLLLWLVIFAAWVPTVLAYYPGILSYDSHTQTQMALGLIPVTRVHPPLHTFFWKGCLYFEEISKLPALTIYGILQLLMTSSVMAYLLLIIIKEHLNKVLVVFSFIFIAFNPVMAVMSLTMTKDVPFMIASTLLVIQLFKMAKAPKQFFDRRRDVILLIAESALACLLRKNMIYALILMYMAVVLLRRDIRKQMFIIAVAFVACFMVVNGPVYGSFGVVNGDSRGLLSVPVQQISRTALHHADELSEEERDSINRFLPFDEIDDLYNPRFFDPVKKTFKKKYFNTHKSEFIKLWLYLLQRYPVEYVDAFLELNIQLWYPGADTIDPYAKRQYIESGVYKLDYYPVKRCSKAPGLLAFYEQFARFTVFEGKLKWMAPLFSISTPIWVILLSMLLLMRMNKNRYVICCLPYFFLWLTYIAGPVSNFRYIFPLFAAYPFFVLLVFFVPRKSD